MTDQTPPVTDITPLVQDSELPDDAGDLLQILQRIADKLGHDLVQRDNGPQDTVHGGGETVIRL